MEERTYYQRHREQLLNYYKEKYRKEHPRKYKKYFLVIAPDGTEYRFERNKDLSKFLGYDTSHIERVQGKLGYRIQRVYE